MPENNDVNGGYVISPYDERDYKFKDLVPLGAINLSDSYESERTPFVYNQEKSEECVPCSYNLVRFMQEQDQSKIDVPFAPSFNYANRPTGEEFEGMYLRSVCKKGLEGSVPWDDFPGFDTYAKCKEKFESNKEALLEKAKPFRISSYYKCNDRTSVKQAIVTCKGVMVGIPVYDCLFEPDKSGYVDYSKQKDTNYKYGHCITIVGYKTDKTGKQWWRIQNSWGKKWGDNGRAWLPHDYPWLEAPYAIVDDVTETTWKDYREKFPKAFGNKEYSKATDDFDNSRKKMTFFEKIKFLFS